MQQFISPEKFIAIWNKLIDDKIQLQWREFWYQWDKWLYETIGKSWKVNNESPLGDYIVREFPDLQYANEDNKIDFVVYPKGNFMGVEMIDGSPLQHDIPTEYTIILEHENYIGGCWQEMVKLTRIKAPLKVLVTYNDDKKDREQNGNYFKKIRENFSKMIKQANTFFPENKNTRYLLIIGEGYPEEPNMELSWHEYLFNISGEEC